MQMTPLVPSQLLVIELVLLKEEPVPREARQVVECTNTLSQNRYHSQKAFAFTLTFIDHQLYVL